MDSNGKEAKELPALQTISKTLKGSPPLIRHQLRYKDMRWYGIFFSENGRDNWVPLYEDYKHGRYWLGGTARLLAPLLFTN